MVSFENSSIQALKTTFESFENPEFPEACLFSNLFKVYNNMNQLPQVQIISQFLKTTNTAQFQDIKQHDASEFFDKVLDQLHEDAILYSKQPDLIESIFRLILSDHEKGVVCSHRKREDRYQWSLALPLNSIGEEEDVNSLVQRVLKKGQSVPKSCKSCQIQHTMLEYCTYEVLPHVLIIQLGRFLSNSDKINKFIGIPDNLKVQVKTIQNSYKLQAIVKHSGTSRQGHYVTVTRNNNSWTQFDDERITQVSAT